jgi:hypothetical protein
MVVGVVVVLPVGLLFNFGLNIMVVRTSLGFVGRLLLDILNLFSLFHYQRIIIVPSTIPIKDQHITTI